MKHIKRFDSPGFRWRGGDVSRIEALSDAVFAFAITLLVVSLEVPKSFQELLSMMEGFVSFGVCFILLIYIWLEHYIFFRRYGIENGVILTLNSALLFVVTFFIYPLKFLSTVLIARFTGLQSEKLVGAFTGVSEGGVLLAIYSSGYLLIFGIFYLMYQYVYSRRESLNLNEFEILSTKFKLVVFTVQSIIAILSISIALLLPSEYSKFSGMIYMLIGPILGVFGYRYGKKLSKLEPEV